MSSKARSIFTFCALDNLRKFACFCLTSSALAKDLFCFEFGWLSRESEADACQAAARRDRFSRYWDSDFTKLNS